MKHFSHLNTATQLIQQYRAEQPLHHFLRSFFGAHKKFGSKDRKRISHLCYVFYRVGRAFSYEIPLKTSENIHQVILAGLFLCEYESDDLLAAMKPAWNEMISASHSEKVEVLNRQFSHNQFHVENIFPATDELSRAIDHAEFSFSHLIQPDLFIRVRPGYSDVVQHKLTKANLPCQVLSESSVRLPNGVRIDDVLNLDKEAVVQDLSSQRVGEFLFDYAASAGVQAGEPATVWDCCAASGGKSILANDVLGSLDLTISDVRESILANLKKRFQKAGISRYKSFTADLSHIASWDPPGKPSNEGDLILEQNAPFDLIIADLPCTGSGTWSRSPEQLYFFDRDKIEKYSQLQKNILTNILPHLKEKGKLLYITCSVFRKENEAIIDFLLERFRLKVERMEVLKGYDKKADTMFAALLSRL
jgi:16S rRNA (cytosine967-C5)-methyltransferase